MEGKETIKYSKEEIKEVISIIRKFKVESKYPPQIDGFDNRTLTTIDPEELLYMLEKKYGKS